ncbi:MAG TPA: hypothetical protein VKK81_09420 [Candidatus Binatia bacterium]|nr:hypothetical protein [Candidatus Binatia bacterium]
MERPPDRSITLEEAARAVHASLNLIEKWIREGRVPTRSDPITHELLVSADGIEDTAEEEAFRLLSHRALAHEDQD